MKNNERETANNNRQDSHAIKRGKGGKGKTGKERMRMLLDKGGQVNQQLVKTRKRKRGRKPQSREKEIT